MLSELSVLMNMIAHDSSGKSLLGRIKLVIKWNGIPNKTYDTCVNGMFMVSAAELGENTISETKTSVLWLYAC